MNGLFVGLILAGQGYYPPQDPDVAALKRFTSVPAIVAKAIRAKSSIRYSGTRLVFRRWGSEVDRHVEFVTRDGLRTRIEFPYTSKYRGQIIVEDERQRRHYFPEPNEIEDSSPRPDRILIRPERRHGLPEPTLRFSEDRGERIAGIPTMEVKVLDNDGNVLASLNIDPKSGAVLQRLAYDAVGTLRASSKFTKIDLHPDLAPNLFVLRHNGAKVITPADKYRRIAHREHFLPLVLPSSSGFEIDHVTIGDVEGQRVLIAQYASLKGRLTVFQTEVGVDMDRLKRAAPRGLQTRVVQLNDRWFIFVGPLDDGTMDSAVEAMRSGTPVLGR